MSIFYNTIYRSSRELLDFLVLFMMISYCLSMCGYIVFGVGAAHPQFDSVGRSLATTLGIAFGHYEYDSVVGQTFGLDTRWRDMLVWSELEMGVGNAVRRSLLSSYLS